MDIHPGCEVGKGVMIDHATGVVFGETAIVGDDCTFLHGVTLGGTGKSRGDRHPKLGCGILVGAGSMILGNITVGDGCKVSLLCSFMSIMTLLHNIYFIKRCFKKILDFNFSITVVINKLFDVK